MLYGLRSNGGEHGSVMTKLEVAQFMLDSIGYIKTANLETTTILEPAAGNGVFVSECLRRLKTSSDEFSFDFSNAAGNNIRAVELDKDKADGLIEKIASELAEMHVRDATIIARMIVLHEDFLLSEEGKFDMVVGNPPYVRYDNIPKAMREKYRERFETFRGRGDLYLAFFEKSIRSIKKDGRVCFICSDRWMKNSYGRHLRRLISSEYSVPFIVNMNNSSAFEEAVDGYPSIILISDARKGSTRYVEVGDVSELSRIWHAKNAYERIVLDGDGESWAFRPITSACKPLKTIEEQDFRIGIGVATGADRIFIGKELPRFVEKEALLPIVISKDVQGGEIVWSGNFVINPFSEEGGLVDLDARPKLRQYLNAAKNELMKRHMSQKTPSRWYGTIDPIRKPLTGMPKILLPDIKKRQKIAIDDGSYYPHHNIYYITEKQGSLRALKLLAAILMSDFAYEQMTDISTLMRGGYVRWQSQNLRKLKLPAIKDFPPSLQNALIEAYDDSNQVGINTLLNRHLDAEVKLEKPSVLPQGEVKKLHMCVVASTE